MDEPGPGGARPLLDVVFADGPLGTVGTVADARARCAAAVAAWDGAAPAVQISPALAMLTDVTAAGVGAR